MFRNLTGCLRANLKSSSRHIRNFSAKVPLTNQIHDSMAPFRTSSEANGFVWTSRYGQITVPDQTIDEYVWSNLSKWPGKTAIVCGVTGRKYSYGQLRDHCAAVALRLRTEFKLNQGDVVAISMPNIPEYAIAVLGALEAGLTITTINPIYTAGWFEILAVI